MIPLSAQAPNRLAAAAGISSCGSKAAEVFAKLREIAATQRRVEGRRFDGIHRSKIILQILPPQQPRHRRRRHFRPRRRLILTHRLPNGRGIPAESETAKRGMKLEGERAPSRQARLAASAAARQGPRIGCIEYLRQRPFEQRDLRKNRRLAISGGRAARNSGNSRPYQRIERNTEGCAAT